MRGTLTRLYGLEGLTCLDKLELSRQSFSGENLFTKLKCLLHCLANKKNKQQKQIIKTKNLSSPVSVSLAGGAAVLLCGFHQFSLSRARGPVGRKSCFQAGSHTPSHGSRSPQKPSRVQPVLSGFFPPHHRIFLFEALCCSQ